SSGLRGSWIALRYPHALDDSAQLVSVGIVGAVDGHLPSILHDDDIGVSGSSRQRNKAEQILPIGLVGDVGDIVPAPADRVPGARDNKAVFKELGVRPTLIVELHQARDGKRDENES